MIAGFLVFHKKNPKGSEVIPQGVPLWSFKTCLRHIYFSWVPEGEEIPVKHDFQVFRGRQAYEFVLEILCGLHSPVVGETEVFGQFKNFWQEQEKLYPLQQVFESLVTDVKKVRKQHLTDLGSQSYGSLVRRYLPKRAQVAIIGGGSLVKDILPWVDKDENDICLYVRNPHKLKELHRQFPRVRVALLGEAILADNVIVAAPVQSQLIHQLIANKEASVIDLRGESHQDQCDNFINYRNLQQFFKDIEKNKAQILNAKESALKSISLISSERFLSENQRPFGWEDICAW